MIRRLFLVVLPAVLTFTLYGPARAQDARDVYEAMGLDQILEIMREEGLAYGEDLRTDMLGGPPGPGFPSAVSRIYAVERLQSEFVALFADSLDADAIAPLLAFYSSEQGQLIVNFEVAARRALLDDGLEESARQIWQDLEGEYDPRVQLIERFVTVNDLIEANVAGSMNSSLAFYEGLSSGNALDGEWTMDRILNTVWEQEGEIRADTKDWVYPYLTLAFEPLSDEDLEAYIALSESDAGQALNAALFAAFDVLFVDISREMGAAVATYMQGEDI